MNKMKISLPKQPVTQLMLFSVDEYLSTLQADGSVNHGRVRTVIGNYFEQLTAKVFGGRIHKTDCNCDYCPDVSACGKFFEVKAVGNSGQGFIYAGRLEKDKQFAEHNELHYCIWHHKVETKLASTVAELKQLLVENTVGYAVLPFAEIADICANTKVEKLNSRYGGSVDNPLYGTGYRFSVKNLTWLSLPKGK